MTTTEKLRLYRKLFGWLFAISLVFIAISVALPWFGFTKTKKPLAPSPVSIIPSPPSNGHLITPKSFHSKGHAITPLPPTPTPPAAPESSSRLAFFVSVASILTSATSFVGFFITTAMGRRREKRESQNADLDLEKKRLELEKLRRELTLEGKAEGKS